MSHCTATRLALVGAGNIARAHVAAAASLPGVVELVAVVDTRRDAAEALAATCGAAAFGSVEEMLGTLGDTPAGVPDAAVVCTPPSARVEAAERLMAAGCSVLLEKPLAHTVVDAEALVRLADAHPAAVAVTGFCHRFTPAVDAMIGLVADGRIGEIVRCENTFAADLPHLRAHWMSDGAVAGGGSLIDTGLHSLDLFAYLFGPATVEGAVFRHGWEGRSESNATVLLRAGGAGGAEAGDARIATTLPVAGVVACGWAENSRFDLRLVGTAGSLLYDFEKPETLFLATPAGSEELAVETHEVRFDRQLAAFAARVAGGSDDAPLCGFVGGLEALRRVTEAAALDSASRPEAPAPSPLRNGNGVHVEIPAARPVLAEAGR